MMYKTWAISMCAQNNILLWVSVATWIFVRIEHRMSLYHVCPVPLCNMNHLEIKVMHEMKILVILTLKVDKWWFSWEIWWWNFLSLQKMTPEVMGNEMGKLLCKNVSGATDTRVSGNHADFNMQSQICISHALVSSLMYVVHEMSMYLMCKSKFCKVGHFWKINHLNDENMGLLWMICIKGMYMMWRSRSCGQMFPSVGATDTRVSDHGDLCMNWCYPHVPHMLMYP